MTKYFSRTVINVYFSKIFEEIQNWINLNKIYRIILLLLKIGEHLESLVLMKTILKPNKFSNFITIKNNC